LMVAEEVAALIESTSCRFVVCLDVLLPLIGANGAVRPDAVFVTTLQDRLPAWDRLLYKVARLHRLGLRGRKVPPSTTELDDALAKASPDVALDRVSPDGPANILPTGGTTGHPKAVVLTHRNLL